MLFELLYGTLEYIQLTVRILPYFQEEMMVQEDPIKVGEDDDLK